MKIENDIIKHKLETLIKNSNGLSLKGLYQIKAALKENSIDSSDTDLSELDINTNYFMKNGISKINSEESNEIISNILKIIKISEIDIRVKEKFQQSFGNHEKLLNLLMNRNYEPLLLGFSKFILNILINKKNDQPPELNSKSKLIYRNSAKSNSKSKFHKDTPNFERSYADSKEKIATTEPDFFDKHIIIDDINEEASFYNYYHKNEANSPEIKTVSPILKKKTAKKQNGMNLNLNLEKINNNKLILNSALTNKSKHTKTISNTEFTPASSNKKHTRHPTQSTNIPKHKNYPSIAEKTPSDISQYNTNKSQISQINQSKIIERKVNEPCFGVTDIPRKKKFEVTDNVSTLLDNLNTPIPKKDSLFKKVNEIGKNSNFKENQKDNNVIEIVENI